ncbi:PP2C family protein-serine/threonine phosphatase [Novosphingobium album (ex Liu et al. 2023)]|uniref:Protein phosphatase 2C domain-containing protein n=1 Tax=Novosphingobium album (ex Liu et al. 2023) TaxID=3031130 RepID=A0ABT5WV06_9SPHN|nr:protein phosphatase 2C domain-containing protein [Novosphingobium album (ex Liu et al. 2023)]MDE8653711.1 protein phosphatase 2C domain-containing protein [Novosphingobium album (ex Liu et al. 2023)]
MATHVGMVRSENEDFHLSSPGTGIWLVADGMGGHAHGKYASQAIASALADLTLPDDIEQACDAAAAAVQVANAEILRKSQELGCTMGSTFVALLVRGCDFIVMWAGDSRAYLLRGGQLFPLTKDHTQVAAMLERGLISDEEAREHPMRHVLSRAVGVRETLQIDAVREVLQPHDVFLLCSDGLHGVLYDTEILEILSRKGLDASQDLIEAVLSRGAPDNVTVTVLEAREPTVVTFNRTSP